MATKKSIKYSEPTGYFPKSVRDKFFKETKKTSVSGTKKSTSKKK